MKITKENVKTILFIAFCIVLMFVCVWQINAVIDFLGYVVTIMAPIIIGFCIAFVLNIPMSFLEKHIFGFLLKPNKKGKRFKLLARIVSVVLTLAIFISIISLLLNFIIPQVANSISSIVSSIPAFTERAISFSQKYLDKFDISSDFITDFLSDSKKILTTVGTFLKDNMNSFVDIGNTVLSGVVNAFLGIFLALYFLFDKEKILYQIKRLSRAVLKPVVYRRSAKVLDVSASSFANFISGQLIEAIILGLLCFIGMIIFRMPFAPLVSVIIGVCALVPILGAWIGAIIGFFLILISNPIKAIWFVVYLIILQQLEGNLIYPRVVGKQVGLPGVWVLLAIVIGSGVMGAFGALLAVPVASVVYILLGEFVFAKEKEAKMASVKKGETEN